MMRSSIRHFFQNGVEKGGLARRSAAREQYRIALLHGEPDEGLNTSHIQMFAKLAVDLGQFLASRDLYALEGAHAAIVFERQLFDDLLADREGAAIRRCRWQHTLKALAGRQRR